MAFHREAELSFPFGCPWCSGTMDLLTLSRVFLKDVVHQFPILHRYLKARMLGRKK